MSWPASSLKYNKADFNFSSEHDGHKEEEEARRTLKRNEEKEN